MLDLNNPIDRLSVKVISEELDANSVKKDNKYMNQSIQLSESIESSNNANSTLSAKKNPNGDVTGIL